MQLRLQRGDQRQVVDLLDDGAGLVLKREEAGELRLEVLAHDETTLLVRINGRKRRARYARSGHDVFVQIDGHVARFHLVDEEEAQDEAGTLAGSPIVRAPMPGKVIQLLVAKGDRVEAGQAVILIEAMKMETELCAAVSGTVETIHVKDEEIVAPEAPLVTLSVSEDAVAD